MRATTRSRKNLILVTTLAFIFILGMSVRIGWIQLVKGDEYSAMALQQQTSDTAIEPERGVIYDRNGNALAISVKCYSVYGTVSEIAKDQKKEKREIAIRYVSEQLGEILKISADDVEKDLNRGGTVRIQRGIDKETADKIRDKELSGIYVVNDTKRSYPLGAFAAQVLGNVTDENVGQSGLELQYNKYLSGIAGRIIDYTDNTGNQLSYSPDNEKYYQARDGYSLVLTIDEVIQQYTEDICASTMKRCNSDRVMAIVMEVETGEVMAMAELPDYDPNEPKVPLSSSARDRLKSMSDAEKTAYWNKMWRNSLICDVYEPGSTFKLLTTSAALEEGVTSMKNTYYCGGSLNVAGEQIQCWVYPSAHGTQALKQAVGNSCNPVFMTLATKMGIETFYDYLENFGITGTTEIDFPSEGSAILQSEESAGPVGVATMGFGQGVAVTPIQLITAVSSLGNDGKLMKPKLVKAIKDSDGNTVEEFKPVIDRKTVSEETAKEMCSIMQYVVDEGGGANAAVKGYKVGAKTGTANKVKENGLGYSDYTYSSCIAMAPMDDPKIAVLVIVDSPRTVRYGSVAAAPAVSKIMGKSLDYLGVESTESVEEKAEKVKVPNVVGMTYSEAVEALKAADLKWDRDDGAAEEDNYTVIKQYPAEGNSVKAGSKIYLYK